MIETARILTLAPPDLEGQVGFVRRIFDDVAEGDLGAVVSVLADDVVVELPAVMNATVVRDALDPDDFQPTGTYRGWRPVRSLLAALKRNVAIDAFEAHSFEAHDDQVTVTGRFDGLSRASGRPLTADWTQVFQLEHGKVARLVVRDTGRSHATRTAA